MRTHTHTYIYIYKALNASNIEGRKEVCVLFNQMLK